jgi:hypothetical protein
VTQPTPSSAGTRPDTPPSDRVRLARLALDAALAMDGVEAGTDGPVKLWVTVDQGQRYPGVLASVLPDGTHSVGLHLVVAPVPLLPLADAIRERVRADAAAVGLEERLGPVDVVFEDLADAPGAAPATGSATAGAPAPGGAGSASRGTAQRPASGGRAEPPAPTSSPPPPPGGPSS